MKKLTNLLLQETALEQELHSVREQIEEINQKEELPKLRSKYEGRYFKYRNSYSCPKDESDYWFIYMKVVKVESRIKVITKSFELDSNGVLIIESNRKTSINLLDQEITPIEYNEAIIRHLAMIDLT